MQKQNACFQAHDLVQVGVHHHNRHFDAEHPTLGDGEEEDQVLLIHMYFQIGHQLLRQIGSDMIIIAMQWLNFLRHLYKHWVLFAVPGVPRMLDATRKHGGVLRGIGVGDYGVLSSTQVGNGVQISTGRILNGHVQRACNTFRTFDHMRRTLRRTGLARGLAEQSKPLIEMCPCHG